MKKFFVFTLIFFMFSGIVKAATACDTSEESKLRQKAANINVNYEIKEEVEKIEDSEATELRTEYFEISILNVTDEFYVIVKNSKTNEERRFSGADASNGIIKFRVDDKSEVVKYTFQIYTSDKTSCKDEKLKTLYLTTPRFNIFSQRAVCEEIPEYYLCQKYVTFASVSEDNFAKKTRSYQSGQENKEGEKVEEKNKTFFDKVYTFLDNSKWYIAGVVVIAAGCYVYYDYSKKNKKRGEKKK